MTLTTESDDELLVTRPRARHMLGGIGETKLWELEKAGEIEVVRIGRRSLVVAQSCRDYVAKLRSGQR
jgi:hypothetical protein